MSDPTPDEQRPWWRGADPGHRLAGKRALVTGAGTAPGGDLFGIGEAIAVLFAAQGAVVAVADVSTERAEATARIIEDLGGRSLVTVGDLAVAEENARCVGEAAMGGLTRDWAYLHGRDAIRVNCLVVGSVFTPMGDQAGQELRRMRLRASLLPSEGSAWDAAWPAVLLASEESRWITGTEIPVDAGTTSTTALGIQLLNDAEGL